jgi:hypothetical protein
MDETARSLRHLIAQYRERLARGESAEMVIFCIRAIREAEQRLAALEKRQKVRSAKR